MNEIVERGPASLIRDFSIYEERRVSGHPQTNPGKPGVRSKRWGELRFELLGGVYPPPPSRGRTETQCQEKEQNSRSDDDSETSPALHSFPFFAFCPGKN